MTIEFRCTQCDKLLRTPAGTEGKKAKCPQCGNVLDIPNLAAAAILPETTYHAPAPPPPRQPSDNPFQSPAAQEMRAQPESEMRRGFTPTRIDLGETLGTAWQIYKANFGNVVLAGFVVLVLNLAISGAVVYAMRDFPFVTRQLVALVSNVPSLWLSLGLFTYLLKIARGEVALFGDVFSGGPYLLPAIGAFLIMYICVVIGFILLIIPGIIVALMLSQAFLMLIDQNAGVIDSLRMSMQVTRGNKLTLFALGLVTMVIVLVVSIFTCGIGYFFVTPFVSLLFVVTYLSMTGQSLAVQR
jgi:phage FluMu protein Com